MSAADGIDRDAPARLRRQGGETLLRDLVRSFLTRTPERLATLRTTRSPRVVEELAHTFKTSCRIIGALGMGDLCEALELDAEQGQLPDAARLAALEDAFARVHAWLTDVQRASP